MIRGLHHVALNTNNFDRMLEFYRDALGFEIVFESRWVDAPDIDAVTGLEGSAARAVMLRGYNAFLELFAYSTPEARVFGPLRPSDRGYTHFCLEVVDIDAEWERLSKAGMTFPGPPMQAGGMKAIYGRDPEGNVIELLEIVSAEGPRLPGRTKARRALVSG